MCTLKVISALIWFLLTSKQFFCNEQVEYYILLSAMYFFGSENKNLKTCSG